MTPSNEGGFPEGTNNRLSAISGLLYRADFPSFVLGAHALRSAEDCQLKAVQERNNMSLSEDSLEASWVAILHSTKPFARPHTAGLRLSHATQQLSLSSNVVQMNGRIDGRKVPLFLSSRGHRTIKLRPRLKYLRLLRRSSF
jgi:hypothetical protein